MRQGSGKPGLFGAPQARYADLDPICVSPYRPAACELPLHEAGHTKAPDHMREPKEKILAFHGAFTHERMLKKKPRLVVAVALANRIARIAWALMTKGGVYQASGAVRA